MSPYRRFDVEAKTKSIINNISAHYKFFAMTNFFINQLILNKQSNSGTGSVTMDKEILEVHIGTCLLMIPPRQLSQCLRESFMLNWENLQETTPDFKQLVTEMMVLLARLDALADQQLKHSSGG